MSVDDEQIERDFDHWWSSDDAQQFLTPAEHDAARFAFRAGFRRGAATTGDESEHEKSGGEPEVR